MGLEYGVNSQSEIMNPQIVDGQSSDEELEKFYGEFDNQVELLLTSG